MTLREMCEQAAVEAISRAMPLDGDKTPRERWIHVADAMERVAKQFAERALRSKLPGTFFPVEPFPNLEAREQSIVEAIAAAERGE